MKVMSHQIDILPYPGFWNRVAKSDIADLGGLYDWFNKGKDYYHHRVKIGDDNNWQWLTLPITTHSGYKQIDVTVRNDDLHKCFDMLQGVYGGCKNWSVYKDFLYDTFVNCKYSKMWELNFKLLIWMRDLLDIHTPMSISMNLNTPEYESHGATDKILTQLSQYHTDTYYCGSGGKNYLDVERINSSGIDIEWATFELPDKFKSYSTVSTLSLIMNFDLDEVRRLFK